MALRLIEIIVPQSKAAEIPVWLHGKPILAQWEQPIQENRSSVRILLEAKDSEAVLDLLQKNAGALDGFRAVLCAVEATVPQPPEAESQTIREAEPKPIDRISREELYNDVAAGAQLTRVYLVTVILSTIVAAIGLVRDDLAVIIGAMVIAPLLGPNVALALGTTLADKALTKRSVKTNASGFLTALSLSIAVGLLFEVDPFVPAIASRTQVALGDILLALASGSAGALAFTTGVPAALIGVMVAVALLPPLAVFGLLIGSGYVGLAYGALLLVATNIICVNLAGVVTFLCQGIRPRTWWDVDRAHKAARNAIAAWTLLLGLLAVLILLGQQ